MKEGLEYYQAQMYLFYLLGHRKTLKDLKANFSMQIRLGEIRGRKINWETTVIRL